MIVLRFIGAKSTLAILGLLASSRIAFAQSTIGDRTQAVVEDLYGPAVFLIVILGLVLGLWLILRGVLRLVELSGQDRPDGLAGPLVTILAGALLVALPHAAGVGLTTFFSSSVYVGNLDVTKAVADLDDTRAYDGASASLSVQAANLGSVGPVSNCLTAENAVPCMAGNIAKNVVPMGIIAVYLFAAVAGLWGFLGCLHVLGQQRSPGEKMPPGWMAKLLVSIFLMNVSTLFTYVSRTLFGDIDGTLGRDGLNDTSSLLRYHTGIADALAPYEELMGNVFIILTLLGVFTLVKGLFIMKAAGEGRSQQTMGTGVVFLVAGMALANFKMVGCLATSTVGFTAFNGLGFCT